jgi:proton-coupled amino acid transporter
MMKEDDHSSHSLTDYTSVVDSTTSLAQEAEEEADEGTTALQTTIHLIKGYVGPGCLSLPWAFSQLGIPGGCFACIVLSYWTSFNCWGVVEIKRSQQATHTIDTYADVGTWAYGTNFGNYVRSSVCIQQLAICTVFLSFIGENLLAIWASGPNHAVVMTLALPAVLGLSCLASLKSLAPFTATGTALLFGAFGLLGIVMVKDWDDRPQPPPTLESLSSLPLALCAILYSYEGICLILPVEGAMAKPRQFKKVFWGSMAVVALVFCAVASFSVYIFGKVTNGSITAYLLEREDDDSDRSMLILANTAVSISVLLTYPLQLFPCLQLVGPWLNGMCRRGGGREEVAQTEDEGEEIDDEEADGIFRDEDDILGTNDDDDDDDGAIEVSQRSSSSNVIPGDSPMLRLGLVLLTYSIAIVVPNVQALISLAGALAGSSTALLIPPLLTLEFIKREDGENWMAKLRCYVLFGLGFIFMCIGTGASIVDIINIYSS